jgi:hypothetical protein
LGAVKKLADATEALRDETTDINVRLAKYRTAFDAAFAELNRRLDESGATLADLNKRLDERDEGLAKIRAEDTKREAGKASVRAWINAQPDADRSKYALLARNNGISEAELLR